MKKTFFLTLFTFVILTISTAAVGVSDLTVEYMSEPMGIDVSRPRFSWKMQSDQYGSHQTAYQLIIATSEDNLFSGEYFFDSGKIFSDKSVDITYTGDALSATTRYYWQVRIWDEKDQIAISNIEWFETGLFGQDWHQAEWIGSSKVNLSPYRSRFTIDYDFSIEEGSHEATFIFGGKSDNQYVSLSITTKDKTLMTLSHVQNGEKTIDYTEDISNIFSSSDTHHVTIDVMGPRSYIMQISIDGNEVMNTSAPQAISRMTTFSINNDSELEPNSNSRLYQIGFQQSSGQNATFSNIQITEDAWNTLLYTDEISDHYVEGDGIPKMWQPGADISAPMLRKQLDISKPLKQARLYATARGIYEFEINGQRVGDDYLNPGWTDYRKRIMYNTFDISEFLKEGKNGVGVTVGIGWYGDHMGFNSSWQDQYGVRPSVLAMIVLDYIDGSKEYIVTNNSWKCYDQGPITANSLFNGVDYDARKEVTGWTNGDFNDNTWSNAEIFTAPDETVILQGYVGLTVKNNVTLTAKSVKKVGDKNYVYDMGQNLAGIPKLLNIKGEKGQQITIHFAEMLYPEVIPEDPIAPYTIETYQEKRGQLYRENYRSALSTDRYILKGDTAGEIFEPRFTYHGFRYLSIEGLDEPLPTENVQALALESIGHQTSFFETSNEDINRLFENAVWGQRGNFLAVPTDCPQRDERMGWTGDAQVFARAATYNMNIDQFYTRWLYTIRDNQASTGSYGGYYPEIGVPPAGALRHGGMTSGGWQEAGVIIPWQVYQQYGDLGLVEEHYPSMCQFMEYLERNATNYIQPLGGTGDWLAPESTNTMLTNTCYSAYAAQLMEQMAIALGKLDDAKRFSRLYENIKTAFNETFVNAEGRTVTPPIVEESTPWASFATEAERKTLKDSEGNILVDTQTSYVLPLQFGLFNETNKPKAIQHLRETIQRSNYTLTTGFVGTPYICLVLSNEGYVDDAYRLITQTEYPSWLFSVKQGATTFWERWNSYTLKNGFGPVSMNSFNHYAYGAIEEWMMSHCIGIQRNEDNPGYKHFYLKPEIGESLNFAKGGFETMYGKIESSWEKQNDAIIYKMIVPANTSATIILPKDNTMEIVIGNEGIITESQESNTQIYEVVSGKYEFISHP